MSTVFNVRCELCETDGPRIRRGAGGTSLWDPDEWSKFLIGHEHHELQLVHE